MRTRAGVLWHELVRALPARSALVRSGLWPVDLRCCSLVAFPAPVASQDTKQIGKSFFNILKGEIVQSRAAQVIEQHQVLGYETGSAPSGNGQVVITNVFRGSSAWYQGLRAGDQVVSERTTQRPNGLDATIGFRRDGRMYQVDLSATGDYRHAISSAPGLGQSGARAAAEMLSVVMTKQAPSAASTHADADSDPSSSEQSRLPEMANSDRGLVDPNQFLTASAQGSFTLNVKQAVQQRAKQALQGRDLVVLIDRSGSMGTTDCPQAVSRWEWCKQQTMQLSADVQQVFPRGFSVVLFNNHTKAIDNADWHTIAEAFQNNQPDGGTDTAGAVSAQFQNYWAHKKDNETSTKPLVVLVITDGAPNDPNRLRKTLIAAANDITRADEISVVFVQVGEDNQASAYLEDMTRNLNQEGAKFNIVRSVLFETVEQRGLFNALADALLSRP